MDALFMQINRADFLPDDVKDRAGIDDPISIGYGQTNSQPTTVALMLFWLNPKSGERILDIGSGSGWTTALLCQAVGSKGRVIALESVPELKEFGQENVANYGFLKQGIAKFVCADGHNGYVQESPFDGILSSACSKKIPLAWQEQLKIGGRIVAPVGDNPMDCSVLVWTKIAENKFKKEEHSGFAFVPLKK